MRITKRQVGYTTMPGPEPLDLYQQRVAELGAAIKEQRLAKGWTQAKLGRAVALDHTAIAHFEKGRHVPRRDVVRRIDNALEARGRLFKLRDGLDDNPDSERVRRYLVKHSRAVKVKQICSHWMPPMLETEEHTRLSLEAGMCRRGGTLEDKVVYRRELRAITQRANAPALRVIIREAVLHETIGNERVMREQLLHLIDRSHDPNIEVRVLPFGTGSQNQDVGFVTMWEEPNGRMGAWRPRGDVSGLFVAGRADIAILSRLYDHLHRIALDQDATRSFIAKAVEELYPCRSSVIPL
ncbi:helix-turn-helix transcriptional regulator [Streptomyces sp. AV19]|uniref:helix-turn-helix domain-containing protein n=1 Tax=Streptomyces sp. AV19 TaxID=2793068 RepID=UPI0018FEF65F|nr:helix-turn-helix transcriptional regulator [Streptomyces sp. AV19]MBH1938208.1 helix-turn-helix transcriptional regulator [Streptomyces sp. AV19]MDG4534847.1 helix-turn-helix transcriptional regulator [Streptomyces sp. AV19]